MWIFLVIWAFFCLFFLTIHAVFLLLTSDYTSFCYFQELSCCSAHPSPLHVCTICCGPSPTFCSQHPSGAVKCKMGAGFVQNSHVGLLLWPVWVNWGSQTAAAPYSHGGSKLKHAHVPQANTRSIWPLFWRDTSKTEPRSERVKSERWEVHFNVTKVMKVHAVLCLLQVT